MGIVDDLREQDRSISEPWEPLTLRLDGVEQQLTRLTTSAKELSDYVKAMDEAHTSKLSLLSTSPRSEPLSTLLPDDESRTRLGEIERTLAVVAQLLSQSEAVKLPDGSVVSRSELGAYLMMEQLKASMTDLTSTSSALVAEVHKKAQLRVDSDKVATAVANRVLNDYGERVETGLRAHEARIASLAEVQVSQAAVRLAETVAAAEQLEHTLRGLRRTITWHGIGNTALAMLPFSLAILAVAFGLRGVGEMAGVGPIFSWIWDAFESTDVWWGKALIGLVGLTLTGALAGAVLRLGKWISDKYRGW